MILLTGAIALTVLAVAGIILLTRTRRGRFYLRIAKAVTTDRRLPRPLRWTAAVGLAVKAAPVPDFGVDEVALLVVVLLLVTVYRPVLASIVEAERRLEA